MVKNQGEYLIEYSNNHLQANINCLTLKKIKKARVKNKNDIFEATNKIVRNFEKAIEEKIKKLVQKETIKTAKIFVKIAYKFRKKAATLQKFEIENLILMELQKIKMLISYQSKKECLKIILDQIY